MTRTKDNFRGRGRGLQDRLHRTPRVYGRNAACQLRDRESLGNRMDVTFGTGSPSVA